ncbi:MAG: DnaB-like helicase N-terminal domain-containing protein, partial [Jannaschia sp.]
MTEIMRLDQGAPAESDGTTPHNVEAEQQLLGALLTDNDLFDRVSLIRAEHFYDPVHARLFDLCASRIQKNVLASPVTLKPFLEEDEGLRALGGPTYL